MSATASETSQNLAAVYDRVVKEARRSFGHLLADEEVVSAAREAVDELLVRQHARVTAFIPVLAMRRLRETIVDSNGSH